MSFTETFPAGAPGTASATGPGAGGRRAPVLEVQDVQVEFHLRTATVKAVDGVSFSIKAGECLGLVGESGCGKTTTGLAIMRLMPGSAHITGGQVMLDGKDLVPLPEDSMRAVRGNDVGMIFQDPMTSLNPTWTIGRQIAEPVRIHKGATKKQALDRAVEVLQLVGMPRPKERVDQYPHQLSGGLRQRVMIAMALACQPRLLIADEPTTALDVTIQAQILDLIDELRQSLQMAVLLVTHDMGVIASRTDRVMVMYAGKIVEGAATDELFARMRHPYSEALFESIPRLDQDRSQKLYSIPGLPPDLAGKLVGCRFAARCRYATSECTESEPLLAPAEGPSPSSGLPSTSTPSVLGAYIGEEPDQHVYACYHPVTSTPAQRLAFQKGGQHSALAAQPALDLFPPTVAETDLLEGDLPVAALDELTELDGYTSDGDGEVASDDAVPVPETARFVLAWDATRDLSGREVVLRLDKLEKQYTVTSGAVVQRSLGTIKAVSNVTFSVRRGETFGLVGESGCGKTTIGRLVVGLEKPTTGAVFFEADEFSAYTGRALRRRRRDLQLMFQDPYSSLDPRMRVRTIVREPLVIQGIGSSRSRDDRVSEVLSEVGLSPKAGDLYPHEFSGGQRQRIGLARALVLQPKLIVADEPVSALDVSVQAQILNLMRSLQERHDLTYILVSHDLAVVKYLADTIGVMYLGKLVETGPADSLYTHAAHPYTQGLIDTIPLADPVAARSRPHVTMRGELPSPMDPPSGCRFRTRCPFAQERCAQEEPLMRPFGPGQYAACHFPLQAPLDNEPVAVGTVPE